MSFGYKNAERFAKIEELKKSIENYNFLQLDYEYIVDELADEIIDILKENTGVSTLKYRSQLEMDKERCSEIAEYVDSCGNKFPMLKIAIKVDFEDSYFIKPQEFVLSLTPFKCNIENEIKSNYCKESSRQLTRAWRSFMKIQYGDSWFNDFKKYIEKRKAKAKRMSEKNYDHLRIALEENYKENQRMIDEKYNQQIDALKR